MRVATRSQNKANGGKHRDNTSGYKGVTWHKRRNKWNAQIMVKYKKYNLGYFNNPEEAHVAYCEAAIKYHGEFANFGENDS